MWGLYIYTGESAGAHLGQAGGLVEVLKLEDVRAALRRAADELGRVDLDEPCTADRRTRGDAHTRTTGEVRGGGEERERVCV